MLKRIGWIGSGMLASALLFAAAASAGDAGTAGARSADASSPAVAGQGSSRIISYPLYVATGARDSTTAATVVHCTNLSGSAVDLYVSFYEYDGSYGCGFTLSVGSYETRTGATRATSLFVEDETCATAPALAQGSVYVDEASQAEVVCTAEVVDPANATPTFLTTLDLFRR